MAQPDWQTDKGWSTGKPMTLLEAFGFSKFTLTYPQWNPALPDASAQAQHPLSVQGNVAPVSSGGKFNVPPKGKIQLYARKLLQAKNWTGPQQWGDFVKLEMSEAGWRPRVKNTSSGALGLAQALGHGNGAATQGTLGNEYGGYGLTNKEAKQANSGDPYMQLKWMMNYIQATYGTPSNAWAFHVSHDWY